MRGVRPSALADGQAHDVATPVLWKGDARTPWAGDCHVAPTASVRLANVRLLLVLGIEKPETVYFLSANP